ncbi:hypothetical protein SDC9_195134 [bioreactor metagenome]|uniref:Uncharacterized protein n=1 Tax=bioreactor metagenome TaxID=1076179 RepID=A0A645I877_9ZZZZ
MLPAFLAAVEQIDIGVPAKAEIPIQAQIIDIKESQAGMVMDQPLPLRQAPVVLFGCGSGDRGDLEFGSESATPMKPI